MPAHDAAADLALLVREVHAAGDIARSYFGGHYKSWDKSKGNPVTEADIAIDRFLKERLLAQRPHYGWLSEETADNSARLEAKRIFVVDPIDGTIAFIKGKPHFTIAAAVVEGGRPVAAIVFNPVTGESFEAAKGGGTRANGTPAHVSARGEIAGCRIFGSRAMFADPRWPEPWPGMRIESRSSIAYRLALVAAGATDALISLSAKHDWDLAAGDLLVHEAGGKVTTHKGEILRYNSKTARQHSTVAGGPEIHARLVQRVRHLQLPGQ